MTESELLEWIEEKSGFYDEYIQLLLASVAEQFDAIEQREGDINWSYLLRCASFFAHSDNAHMQDIALRIAQTCLQDEAADLILKNSAEFILNILANRRAIELAKEKNLIQQSSWQDSFVGNLNWIKHDFEHTIWLKDGSQINVNGFQKSFWEALEENQCISISAPTSAGKSHLIKQWVLEKVSYKQKSKVVYLVPTRALISEVEADFHVALSDEIKQSKIHITSFPFIQFAQGDKPCIFVLTQERLQLLLLQEYSDIDILIVDEAYKIADSERGVLLQHVIEKASAANSSLKIIYISPQASNPGLLVENSESSFDGIFEDVTVNQNLIWATQKRGAKWQLELCQPNHKHIIGELTLPSNPSPVSLRLPMVAYTLGKGGGNIIYVNGAADAEKAAQQLCDLVGFDNKLENQRIDDLIELCRKVIHREYRLIEALKYGVAFHYGNIPLIIREEIESLFREGILNFLVCTSTLVEGVNLPCKNIFIRSPKRGSGNPMNSADFWNLAGRAGRWGKDFQGNIICVDPVQWHAPITKKLVPLSRATEDALERQEELVNFIASGTPRTQAASKDTKILESMASYLTINAQTYGSVKDIPWMKKVDPVKVEELDRAITNSFDIEPELNEIVKNHLGISPLAIQAMFKYFQQYGDLPENLLVPYASDTDAVSQYLEVFRRMYNRLTNEFGSAETYWYRQAIATVNWMQGKPIRKIIEARKQALPQEEIHKTIREVLYDIETVARYRAPKYIACYNDILKHYFYTINRLDLAEEIIDITLYLEMGVNTATQLALLNLGLTRTSAVEIKEYITADDLNEKECLEWLQNPNNDWRTRDLPRIVKREIEKVLEIHAS